MLRIVLIEWDGAAAMSCRSCERSELWDQSDVGCQTGHKTYRTRRIRDPESGVGRVSDTSPESSVGLRVYWILGREGVSDCRTGWLSRGRGSDLGDPVNFTHKSGGTALPPLGRN